MDNALVIKAGKDVYDIRDITESGYTLTIGDLIDILQSYPKDKKVVISNDGGYTYGKLTENRIFTKTYETFAEEKEREEREEREWEDSLED